MNRLKKAIKDPQNGRYMDTMKSVCSFMLYCFHINIISLLTTIQCIGSVGLAGQESFVRLLQLLQSNFIYWSPRLARSHYCQQLSLSVCLSMCLSLTPLQIASFLFLDGIEPFSNCQFSMRHSTKLYSSIFDLGPLTPKIYSPKLFLHKIAYKSARSYGR